MTLSRIGRKSPAVLAWIARTLQPSTIVYVSCSPDALAADARRRELLKQVETLKAERNAVSKAIGKMKDPAERQAKIDEQKGMGDKITALDAEVRQVDEKLTALVSALPNIPDARTPVGKSDEENVVLRTVGEPKQFDFAPQPHWDLGPEMKILDLERAAKITGARCTPRGRRG